MKDFNIGTRGRIISECFISSEVEITSNGIMTANEQWREDGEFSVIRLEEEFIVVMFDGEEYEWYIDESELDNVESL
jgi:hypothetical protein